MKVRFEYRADGNVGPELDEVDLEMTAIPRIGDYVDINEIAYVVHSVHWEVLTDKVYIELLAP